MNKLLKSMIVVLVGGFLANGLQANYTLFDLAKDSTNIVRGEFVELERTKMGDRLTLRCDKTVKGNIVAGTEIVLEPFEIQKADDALGREVIVGFDLHEGSYIFNKAPFSWRSFYFESTDPAPNGLDLNEKALSDFVAVNSLYEDEIIEQLRMRHERKTKLPVVTMQPSNQPVRDLSYEGEFSNELINAWKVELLKQMKLKGSWAARDAAKAVVDHEVFKGKMTVAELQQIGMILPNAQIGTLGRAYMIEAIRREVSAYPSRDELLQIVREETSQSVVGKIAGLLMVDEDRAGVLESIGSMIVDNTAGTQTRVNAMQVLLVTRDTDGLSFVRDALQSEMENSDFDKDVVRAALKTMRAVPSEDNTSVLEAYMDGEQFAGSWELRQRTWIAYACIDSAHSNAKIADAYNAEQNKTYRRFLQKMLLVNRELRLVIMIHNED